MKVFIAVTAAMKAHLSPVLYDSVFLLTSQAQDRGGVKFWVVLFLGDFFVGFFFLRHKGLPKVNFTNLSYERTVTLLTTSPSHPTELAQEK